MGREIGQESRHQPAVLWDGSLLHMVFSSNGGDNRILYATSPDGLKWTPGSDTGQTSGAARPSPIHKGGLGTEWNLLVRVCCQRPIKRPNRTCRPHGIQPRVKTDRLDLSPGPVAALDQSQNSNAPAVTREAEEDRDR